MDRITLSRRYFEVAAMLYDVKLLVETQQATALTTSLLNEIWPLTASEPKDPTTGREIGNATHLRICLNDLRRDRHPESASYMDGLGKSFDLYALDGQEDEGDPSPMEFDDVLRDSGFQQLINDCVKLKAAVCGKHGAIVLTVEVVAPEMVKQARYQAAIEQRSPVKAGLATPSKHVFTLRLDVNFGYGQIKRREVFADYEILSRHVDARKAISYAVSIMELYFALSQPVRHALTNEVVQVNSNHELIQRNAALGFAA